MYGVSEVDGVVEVCISVLDGELDREITLLGFTTDGTATGKYKTCMIHKDYVGSYIFYLRLRLKNKRYRKSSRKKKKKG